MKVIKFGGTSIGTPDLFFRVAEIISGRFKEEFTIVVLSAIGGITDKLINAIESSSNGNQKYIGILEEIKSIHYDSLSKVIAVNNQHQTKYQLDKLFSELENKLNKVFLLQECYGRISDSIVSYGELLSSTLLVELLKSQGINSEFHNAKKLIRTNSNYGNAEVDFSVANHLLREWYAGLNQNQIPVVNGFTGSDENGYITTLGRSGSDFTATIIGGALNASIVEIWTDVDGVLSADPKIVSSAITLDQLSYNEASSLAVLGGKVIHPKTIAPVEKQNVPISILNTFNPKVKGTFIGNADSQNDVEIKTITFLKNLLSISIYETESIYGQKIYSRLFGLLAQLEIPIITIIKSANGQSMSLIVQSEFEHLFLEKIKSEFIQEIEKNFIGNINSKNNLSLVSVIGISQNVKSLIVRRIHDVLDNYGIHSLIFLDDPYSLNISFIVDETEVEKTVNVLHEEFFGESITSAKESKAVNFG